MTWMSKAGLMIALIAASWPINAGADEIPAFWRKSMTNDPATNYPLAQAMKPLDSKPAETLRILMLARIIITGCEGAKLVPEVSRSFQEKNDLRSIKGDDLKEAEFLAQDRFKYLDIETVVHLCAGSEYMFGRNGHLVAGLIRGGNGEPKSISNGKGPYVRLPSLQTQ